MALIDCPYCKNKISDKTETCPQCSKKIHGIAFQCPECLKTISSTCTDCPFCGFPINESKKDKAKQFTAKGISKCVSCGSTDLEKFEDEQGWSL